MPRPTSIVDAVGFAESPVAARVKRPPASRINPVIWGESQQFVWRRGGVPEEQVGWVSNPKKLRWTLVGGSVGVLGFASLLMTNMPSEWRSVSCMVCLCLSLAIFAATTSWSDARIGGVRFVRVAPLARLRAALAARSSSSEALAQAATELLAQRHAYRVAMKSSARASDSAASPVALRLMMLSQAMSYLPMVFLPLSTIVPALRGAMLLVLPVMFIGLCGMFYFGWRKSVSRRVDERQRAGVCPDCGYNLGGIGLGGIGDDPALHGLVPGCGPARCPECGVKYPLVPPPTPREVAEGNRPRVIR
jgi:hypothetical protein